MNNEDKDYTVSYINDLNNTPEYRDTEDIKKPKSKNGLWAILGGLFLLLNKFKFILLLIFGKLKFLLVFLKLGKFMSTFISMSLMIVVYAQIYGWAFGLGFVLLILIHEMGHYWTAKQTGLNVSTPFFIPFVGAFINMKEQPKDAVTEAKVALGGPILGSLGALLCAFIYPVSGDKIWLALAYSGFFINLFNLIPFHPLDGGRIVTAISTKMWLIGIPVILVTAFIYFNPIILLLLFMGGLQLYRHWKNPNPDYYNIPFRTRITFALGYFGLLIFLGLGIGYIHSLNIA
jgi:Zn-dependent protease